MAVGGRLPRHVGEPGDPVGACAARSPSRRRRRAPRGDRPGWGRRCVRRCSFGEHDPESVPARPPGRRADAAALAAQADLRLLVHLDLGDHPAGRGIQPGEVDAGGLADQAASSVAADEVLRSERRVVGQLDIDAGVVLREAHHLAAAKDRNAELTDPVGQDGLEVALPQREHVVVAGGEVADVQRIPAKPGPGCTCPAERKRSAMPR